MYSIGFEPSQKWHKKMLYRAILLVSVFISAHRFYVIGCTSLNEIACPNYQTGIIKARKLAEFYDKTVKDFWNKERPKLTKNAMKLKNVLLNMANSDDKLWENAALSVSVWSWIYLRELDKNPSFCVLTEIVNATVTCFEEHDYEPLLEALTLAQKNMNEGISLALNHGIKRAGCSQFNHTNVELSRKRCYQNGFVYNIDKMCKIEGHKYPNKYISIIKKLYKSNTIEDRIFALIATAFLSEPFSFVTEEQEKELNFEIYAIANTDRIPERCCINFIEQTKSLLLDFEFELQKLMESAKKEAKCYNPYHRQMCNANVPRTNDLQPRRLINIRY